MARLLHIRLLQIEKNSSLRRNNTKSVTKGWRELGKVKKASSNVVAWSNNFIIWNICQCTILRYIILARRRAQKSDFERFASLSPFDCTTRLPLPSPKSSRVFVCLCFFRFYTKISYLRRVCLWYLSTLDTTLVKHGHWQLLKDWWNPQLEV